MSESFSTWVTPAARLSRSTIVVGSRSNGPTSAFGVPRVSCLFPCPAATARSTCCQLVYGGAVSGRALFPNDDRSFIYAQRPVLLSGIGDFVRWADLKDRCVFLRLLPIPRTRCRGEDEFWKAFHDALRRLAPQLRMHGMSVSFERRNEGRMTVLKSERALIAPTKPNSTRPNTSQET
jgi:hypothetical protein